MVRKYQNTIIRALVILILLLIQIAFVILLPKWLKINSVVVYFLIEAFSVILMFSLIADNANSAYRIFWLGVVLLLPISGHVMYELWGKEGAKKKQHKAIQETIDFYRAKKEPNEELQRRIEENCIQNGKISRYLCNNACPAYDNTEMTYFSLGEKAFKRLMIDLQAAEKFIFISFFTIADGAIWEAISEILIEKARAGIEVKIMYDDAGSIFQLSDASFKRMKRENIEIKKFNAIERNFRRQYFQYRNHQKIVVIDGNISYTGGINVSDRYANINSPYGHWKDVAVRMYGQGSWGMTLTFLGMWDKKLRLENVDKYMPDTKERFAGICQPYADGPANNPDNPARDLYHLMANTANRELLIMTPYLILDDETKECLCLAAKSGTTVKIITPGIPDKKRTKLLTEWNYGELLKAGVRIFEYTPGFVHAKMCLNDTGGFIGTVNMDFRSFYLHYECGVWFCEAPVYEEIYKDYNETLTKCREITLEEWNSRPFSVRLRQMILQSLKSQF